MIQSSPGASLVDLYSSAVICNSTKGSTLADFLHTCTLNCREKSDVFRESSKKMASECDVTSERYRMYVAYIHTYYLCTCMSRYVGLCAVMFLTLK